MRQSQDIATAFPSGPNGLKMIIGDHLRPSKRPRNQGIMGAIRIHDLGSKALAKELGVPS